MRTTVIGFCGGAGCGKSTLAAGLFSAMKNEGKSVELVTEVAKDWAWKKWPITEWDQLHIFGEQVWREAKLYGKVDYIISDSPLIVQAFYEQKYTDCTVVQNATLEFLKWSDRKDVTHLHYFLPRLKKYVAEGRYETEKEAVLVDFQMRLFVRDRNISAPEVEVPDKERINYMGEEVSKLEREKGRSNPTEE